MGAIQHGIASAHRQSLPIEVLPIRLLSAAQSNLLSAGMTVSSVCRSNGLLYTLNGQCQDARWPDLQADMRVAAESFRVSAPKTSIPGWGSQP